MKRILWITILLTGLLLCLSGCMSQGVDELFAIPRTSETHEKLQEKIKSEIGGADAVAPASGNNTQTIQLVDLDHDGVQEAIAFYRDSSAERPLKIAIFKADQDGEYERYALIEGAATDIESIEYCDLGGDGALEILISWQVSPSVHTLEAYSVGEGQAVRLMQSGFSRYLTMDMTGNGKMDILLIHTDSSEPAQNRVELYIDLEGAAMELHSSAPISEGIVSVVGSEAGQLQGAIPALFVSSDNGDNYYITDIFSYIGAGIKNITLNETERRSLDTLRYYTNVGISDINDDQVMEIPISKKIPNYNPTGASNFFRLNWQQYDINGIGYKTITTYHNNSDGWYLELLEHWDGVITLNRQDSITIGERAVVFSYWTGDEAVAPVPFLTIYRLSGNNRGVHAGLNNRFVLWEDSDVIYAAEFKESSWNCGLDEDSLSARFRTI